MSKPTHDPRQTEIWTILRMIDWGKEYFRQKRVDSPRLTIELMLASLLEVDRFDLYMQFDRPLLEEELAELRSMIKRRVAGEPLQYIVGETGFYGRTFKVRPGALIPRPETEILVEEALRRTHPLRVLDIGTGSGCIAVTVALEKREAEVLGIDISSKALEIARENAHLLDAHHIEFRELDFMSDADLESLGSFDLVLSNPPYISDSDFSDLQLEVREHEPREALLAKGDSLQFYRRIAEVHPRILRSPGDIFVEVGYDQAAAVIDLFRNAGLETEVYRDLEKVDRIVHGRKAKKS